jgi:hypothetical protein
VESLFHLEQTASRIALGISLGNVHANQVISQPMAWTRKWSYGPGVNRLAASRSTDREQIEPGIGRDELNPLVYSRRNAFFIPINRWRMVKVAKFEMRGRNDPPTV